MLRKASLVYALVATLSMGVVALPASNANGVVYGTTADCNACAKCYHKDAHAVLDSTCGEVKTTSPLLGSHRADEQDMQAFNQTLVAYSLLFFRGGGLFTFLIPIHNFPI